MAKNRHTRIDDFEIIYSMLETGALKGFRATLFFLNKTSPESSLSVPATFCEVDDMPEGSRLIRLFKKPRLYFDLLIKAHDGPRKRDQIAARKSVRINFSFYNEIFYFDTRIVQGESRSDQSIIVRCKVPPSIYVRQKRDHRRVKLKPHANLTPRFRVVDLSLSGLLLKCNARLDIQLGHAIALGVKLPYFGKDEAVTFIECEWLMRIARTIPADQIMLGCEFVDQEESETRLIREYIYHLTHKESVPEIIVQQLQLIEDEE